MIRMILLGLGFLAVTAGLLFLQPGKRASLGNEPIPELVTRTVPTLPDQTSVIEPPSAQPAAARAPEIARPVAPAPAMAPRPSSGTDMDDEALRRLTWSSLNNLNHATGRDSAPGQPGSLLHTIVRRSLKDADGAPAPSPRPTAGMDTYVVQIGDSLVSIAEKVYGDVNMTGLLFSANQAELARPDDLRPGQVLVLPRN